MRNPTLFNVAKLKPVTPLKPEELKKFREKKLKITQDILADFFGVSLKTIQRWETGRIIISGSNLRLLRIMIHHPSLIKRYFNNRTLFRER